MGAVPHAQLCTRSHGRCRLMAWAHTTTPILWTCALPGAGHEQHDQSTALACCSTAAACGDTESPDRTRPVERLSLVGVT